MCSIYIVEFKGVVSSARPGYNWTLAIYRIMVLPRSAQMRILDNFSRQINNIQVDGHWRGVACWTSMQVASTSRPYTTPLDARLLCIQVFTSVVQVLVV